MKTWNNEKFRLSNHKEGDAHSDILDSIKVGDEWIDGGGVLHICTGVSRKENGDAHEFQGIVERRIAKKDRTPNKSCRTETFVKWNGFWK